MTKSFSFKYDVKSSGWADGEISNGIQKVEVTASYLHDTLSELCEMTLDVLDSATSGKVIFMNEPGEHHLIVTKLNETELSYQLFWYDDWESWGEISSDLYTEVISGSCSISIFKEQVVNALKEIYTTLGPEIYKKRWIEHDFPENLYKKLLVA